ncbi:uncharacterized protein LOC117299423 [Asterias rubens]|uniref:uncharacterized protein LOC117299423 n=1 Tax=Asterias rubens TaxID=7604 RepID=UPI0014555F74|nr:uncharacterized protein LOC117299423 [Asterias rubens]
MFPKGTVPDKLVKKEAMVYLVGEKDVQVALKRASRTEVKRAAICACAVVLTTLILVAGTLGSITLWLSFHHSSHIGHYGLFDGNHGHAGILPTSVGKTENEAAAGHTPHGDKGQDDVTESFTAMPGVATDAGDIVIDEGDRGSSQSATTTAKPTHHEEQTTETAPSVDESKSSVWESFSAPLYSSIFGRPYDYSEYDESDNPEVISGSGLIPDAEGGDYVEIPYRPTGGGSDYSTYDPSYDTGSDPDVDSASGSGSGDDEEGENSGDYFVPTFQDTLQVVKEERVPKLTTPQEFTAVRYPIPVTDYRTLCTPKSCTIGFMSDDRVEVIETDLQMRPQKLTVLQRGGGKLFTIIRDEAQGYRAILLEETGICLLARLEDMQNLKIRRNSAKPIIEQLRVTLSLELPEQLLGQISGPITETCRNVPVFWAQQVGDGDDISIINRLRRSLLPSRGGDYRDELTIEGGIHFQCCWCADEYDPCPCQCGFF